MNEPAERSIETLSLRVVDALAEVDRAAWDRVANPPGAAFNPFVSWDFLEAMEASGCAAPSTGWTPRHLLAEDDQGRLVGAAPAYLKAHSRGEYVFDHGWADAYMRAIGPYYPKLLCASPFTPVTGPRLLSPDPSVRSALSAGLIELGRRLSVSSVHVTFPSETEWSAAGEAGWLLRQDQQFVWRNEGYRSFEDFLDTLQSRKRKALRKERATAQDGVEIARLSGEALSEAHWDAFFEFYMDTGSRKWGSPYMNRDAFSLLHERLRDRIVLVMARREGRWIAGALNFVGSDALFGRYWGRVEDRACLHFELCYYQAIEEAIERGLARVEAGAQGEHKLARGYAPHAVYSYHWAYHPGFRDAIEDFLSRERQAVEAERAQLDALTPFRKAD